MAIFYLLHNISENIIISHASQIKYHTAHVQKNMWGSPTGVAPDIYGGVGIGK